MHKWLIRIKTLLKATFSLERTNSPSTSAKNKKGNSTGITGSHNLTPIGGSGGNGGSPTVTGNNNTVVGGQEGAGGSGASGGDGGAGIHHGDNLFIMGGEGGEAGQLASGGKGERSPFEILGHPNIQLPDGTRLWDKGRGGNGASPSNQG